MESRRRLRARRVARMERVRNVEPARKRVNCLRARGEVTFERKDGRFGGRGGCGSGCDCD